MLPETVLQFGTGKFLRGFADLFLDQMNRRGQPIGRVVVVQSTGSDRAEILNARKGRYHVAIRGLDRGVKVDRTIEVQSVSRALVASRQWDEVLEVARSKTLRAIVSNTTEAGYALDPRDVPASGGVPHSFPAKLLCVLKARFEAGLPPVAILPCELLERNGSKLLGLLVDLIARWDLAPELRGWIETECSLPDTLVDRIVSAPSAEDLLAASDPLLAVAEPYASWLFEGRVGLPELLEHPSVRCVEGLEPYHLRKVRILNGAHTALVAKARPLGLETVRQAVEDDQVRPWLESLLFEEIVPTLEGRTEGPEQFARDTLQRFANPFLEHRLADIALHHDVKLQTRLVPTRDEFRQRFGRSPERLEAILAEASSGP